MSLYNPESKIDRESEYFDIFFGVQLFMDLSFDFHLISSSNS